MSNERVAYLERELVRQQKQLHDQFMAHALSNPNIVTAGMSPTEAARTCCRYADAMLRARKLEAGP